MLINRFFLSALLLFSPCALAAPPPMGGSQMQQIPPTPSTPPISPTSSTPIPATVVPKAEAEQGLAPESVDAERLKISVKQLTVIGAQTYSATDLLAAVGFKAGEALTFSELRGLAVRIADYYHQKGYFVAQAYLPAQDIKDGRVTIAVIEGEYGRITLRNETNLADDLLNNLLAGLNSGERIAAEPLENRLLLLSDLPGVQVRSTLLPGASVGASDLIVDVTPGRRVTGSVDADNAGNRYTGEPRLGATLNFNNPSGYGDFATGDVATLRALTSGAGLNYARAAYQRSFGKTKVGAAYSVLTYALGREFESLQSHGTAKIASIYGSYPLIRSRHTNLYAQLAFDAKTFEDKVDASATLTRKKIDVLIGSLYGDWRDNFGDGAMSTYALTWAAGQLDLKTSVVQSIDAATAHSNGAYNKLGFAATRLQKVTGSMSAYVAINGQFATKNLDVAEKMEIGGMYAVRAYPEGEAYADQGYVLNLEARMQWPTLSEAGGGSMQLIGFVDSGRVMSNKHPWSSGPNRRTLSGAGIGVHWSGAQNFVVKAYYAHKLGHAAATSAPDSSGRFWIQAVKYF